MKNQNFRTKNIHIEDTTMHSITIAYVHYIDRGLPVPAELQARCIRAGYSPSHFIK